MGARLAWIAQRITAVARVLVRASTGTARVVTERLPLVYHVTVVILSAAIASTIPFTLAFVAEKLLGYWSAIRDERTFLVGTEVAGAPPPVFLLHHPRANRAHPRVPWAAPPARRV